MQNKLSQPLRIIVFGATGRTGKHVLDIALNKVFFVTAVARNPAAISVQHSSLKIVKGDLLQPLSFSEYMHNHDAVISCVGNDSTKPTTLYSQSVQHILAGMKAAGINRIMCMSAEAVVLSPKLPFLYRMLAKYVVQKILKHPFADLRLMEKILETSGTNYTIVRPPMLTDKPLTGHYRFELNNFLDRCLKITRADLACFMVDNILNEATYKSWVEVAN